MSSESRPTRSDTRVKWTFRLKIIGVGFGHSKIISKPTFIFMMCLRPSRGWVAGGWRSEGKAFSP